MDFMAFLAPVALVFSLAAIAKVDSLKKEVEHLREEVEQLRDNHS